MTCVASTPKMRLQRVTPERSRTDMSEKSANNRATCAVLRPLSVQCERPNEAA